MRADAAKFRHHTIHMYIFMEAHTHAHTINICMLRTRLPSSFSVTIPGRERKTFKFMVISNFPPTYLHWQRLAKKLVLALARVHIN